MNIPLVNPILSLTFNKDTQKDKDRKKDFKQYLQKKLDKVLETKEIFDDRSHKIDLYATAKLKDNYDLMLEHTFDVPDEYGITDFFVHHPHLHLIKPKKDKSLENNRIYKRLTSPEHYDNFLRGNMILLTSPTYGNDNSYSSYINQNPNNEMYQSVINKKPYNSVHTSLDFNDKYFDEDNFTLNNKV